MGTQNGSPEFWMTLVHFNRCIYLYILQQIFPNSSSLELQEVRKVLVKWMDWHSTNKHGVQKQCPSKQWSITLFELPSSWSV